MPRIGCVLAGGSWDLIEAIIKKVMTVDTYVYTIAEQKDRWPTQYEDVAIIPPVAPHTALRGVPQEMTYLDDNGSFPGDDINEDLSSYFR